MRPGAKGQGEHYQHALGQFWKRAKPDVVGQVQDQPVLASVLASAPLHLPDLFLMNP